ncbi:MAG TPA: SRPBCC domain-containing protein [Acidobacteriota bacterium]|nr:SRPBCC domain-containing protein [Acidobacteriota bacterium]
MINVTQANKGRIEKKVLIKASPAIIFQALTDARDLVRWFCDRATCDPKEGGELAAYWKAGKSGQKGRAVFTKFMPGSSLELLWVDDGTGEGQQNGRHVLSYTIRERRGTSEVIMRDDDNRQQDDDTYAFLDLGWNSVLLELKDYCERKERSSKAHPSGSPE